jgi:hypothetical protein
VRKFRQLFIGIFIGALIFNSIPISAAVQQFILTKSVYKVFVDGKEYADKTYPILTYKGIAYAPLGKIMNLLGTACVTDTKTKTINLGKPTTIPKSTPEVTPTPVPTVSKLPKIGAPGVYSGTGDNSELYNYVKFAFSINSADGVSIHWAGQNLTKKTINYYTANIAMYNPVGDPAYDTITGKNKFAVKYVGPIAPNGLMILDSLIAYTNVCDKIIIESFDLIYSDKTKETVPYGYSTTLEVED